MQIQRIVKHALTGRWQLHRAFSKTTLDAIEKAIKASEAAHSGEIRFVVEGALEGWPLLQRQSARQRAIDLFSQLRVWDTEHNNGLLIYVLLADRAVEIVADRGIDAKVGAAQWDQLCREIEAAFKRSDFEAGALAGLRTVTRHLVVHFPIASNDRNELPDRPVLL